VGTKTDKENKKQNPEGEEREGPRHFLFLEGKCKEIPKIEAINRLNRLPTYGDDAFLLGIEESTKKMFSMSSFPARCML
jgi:hypothetical protein